MLFDQMFVVYFLIFCCSLFFCLGILKRNDWSLAQLHFEKVNKQNDCHIFAFYNIASLLRPTIYLIFLPI